MRRRIKRDDIELIGYRGNKNLIVFYDCTADKYGIVVPELDGDLDQAKALVQGHLKIMEYEDYSPEEKKREIVEGYVLREDLFPSKSEPAKIINFPTKEGPIQ